MPALWAVMMGNAISGVVSAAITIETRSDSVNIDLVDSDVVTVEFTSTVCICSALVR